MSLTFDDAYRAATDRFIPDDRSTLDEDGVRRARLALAIVAGILACSVISLTWLTRNGVFGNILPVSLLAVAMLVIPVVLRRTGSLRLTGHGIAAVTSLALIVMVIHTGAQAVPPLALLPGIPMLATLVSGTRAGVVWAGISATIIGVSFALFRGGLEPRIDLPPDFLEQGRFMGALFMLVFVFLVTYCYEHLKNRALADLEEEKARQIELRDRLLSHVSHELRTPIAAAEQFVSLVLDGVAGKVEPQQRELLDGALRNTHQLVEMIDHLVTVSRARAAETAPRVELVEIEVEPAVRAAIARHQPEAATHDVSLDVDIEPALPTAHADENAIAAVLDHLLDNAIKYSPAGGRVVVYASRLPSGRVQIGVHDDGPGIHPDQLEEIFDGLQPGPAPEWRSRNGLGLGLAIARVLVEAMDGEISVDSRVGAGSRFDFTMAAIERNHRIES